MVNRGHYAITRVQARFFADGTILSYDKIEHLSSWHNLPPELRGVGELSPSKSIAGRDVLTPADLAMRFLTDDMAERFLVGSYPIVRWQDHWGTWWEHKKGVVREITNGEEWNP